MRLLRAIFLRGINLRVCVCVTLTFVLRKVCPEYIERNEVVRREKTVRVFNCSENASAHVILFLRNRAIIASERA